jgi:expansin (peptidoglycan-binding protein)
LSEKATKIKNESLASQAAAAAAVEAQAAAAASEASAAAETHAATTATEANTYWQKYIGHCLLLDFILKNKCLRYNPSAIYASQTDA